MMRSKFPPKLFPWRQAAYPVVMLFAFYCSLIVRVAQTKAQGNTPAPIVHISAVGGQDEGKSNALLIGAASRSRWIEDKNVQASLHSGQVYHFYSLTSPVGEDVASKPELGPASGSAWWISFKQLKKSKSSLVGIAGVWNALPRPVKSESVTQPVYLNVVADVLKQKGLMKARPHISKIVRVDLEGKGKDSVVIEASSPGLYENPFAETTIRPGAYSFVIVRTPVAGKVKTLILDGDYHGKKDGGYNVVRLSHVLDLNGDAIMEIVVEWNYYEGGGVRVYRLKNGRSAIVLQAADGA